jgi:hypothetical protein
MTRGQTKLHFPLFVRTYCNKNWRTRSLHTSYTCIIYKILPVILQTKPEEEIRDQYKKHTFSIIVGNSYILINKTLLFLVNTVALSCR